MKKRLFNPFVYIAGTRALLIGWAVMLVTAIIGYLGKMHFDGALDNHILHNPPSSCFITIAEQLIDWACLVIPLYGLGRKASDSAIRFIDIAGTVALAKWPTLFIALLGFIPEPPLNENASIGEVLKVATNPLFILQGLLGLLLLIWTIALLYNAFSVSTNLKGSKAVTAFIAGLIIAEAISKVIFFTFHI